MPPKSKKKSGVQLSPEKSKELKQTAISAWLDLTNSPFSFKNLNADPPPAIMAPTAPKVRSQSQQQAKKPQPPKRITKSSMEASRPNNIKEGNGQPLRPVASRSGKLKRRRTLTSAVFDKPDQATDTDTPPAPKPAWDAFSEHIKTFNSPAAYTLIDNSQMDLVLHQSGSEICKKILKDMKDQIERRRAKEQLMLQKAMEAEANARMGDQSPDLDDSTDSEDEDDEEVELRRRKEEAQRHWGIIRRDVQERIRIRKEKNPAGGTWNALRSQLRAMTRADNVRKELYEKYGIVAKDGQRYPQDIMKPTLSIDVKDVVNKFNSAQIRRLRISYA